MRPDITVVEVFMAHEHGSVHCVPGFTFIRIVRRAVETGCKS